MKAIAISLAPNYRLGDFFPSDKKLVGFTGLFDSGRTAGYFLLKSLGVGPGNEVIVQAFTCVAVENLVKWTGATPVFCDVDETLNIDPGDLKRKITKKTKVVIYQGTMGNIGKIEEIREICQKNGIILVGDCAHFISFDFDHAFYSFGRDKVISGVWGGAAITDQVLPNLPQKTAYVEYILAILSYFIIRFYEIGKLLHYWLRRANLISKVLTDDEKSGIKPAGFYSMPKLFAGIAAKQLARLDEFIAHRRELAKYYAENLGLKFCPDWMYLRFNIFVEDPDGLRRFAAQKNIFLGDWYNVPVAPRGAVTVYRAGACLQAEKYCQTIVNLPTNPNLNLDDAKKVVEVVKLWSQKTGMKIS